MSARSNSASCPEDVEHKLPRRRIGVDRFLQALQAYAFGPQPFGSPDEIFERSAQPVEAPHYQRITGAQVRKRLLQIRPLGHAAGGVFEDPFAPGLCQRIALQVECLVVGGDPCVADQHRSVSGNSSSVVLTIS